MTFSQQAKKALAIAGTVAIALVLVIGASFGRLNATLSRQSEPISSIDNNRRVPPGPVLRLVSLGFDEMAADMVWLDALSTFGLRAFRTNDPTWLDSHFDAIIELDPSFAYIYEWGGTVLIYGGGFDRASIEGANRLLERGVRRFPTLWNLWFMLGVNYMTELPRTTEDREQREEWRHIGSAHLSRAAGLPNSPATLRLTVASLEARRGDWSSAVGASAVSALRDTTRSNAISARYLLLRRTGPVAEALLIAPRRLVEAMNAYPDLPALRPTFGLALHPAPSFLFPVDRILPPPPSEYP
ncbi:MAG: hypothetical protein ACI81R_000836 [Bradymonadia bacterium]|jgi:hypothetical protein